MARVDLLLRLQAQFTGIDFVRVENGCDQRRLRAYFLTNLSALTVPFSTAGVPLGTQSIVIEAEHDKTLRKPRVLSIAVASSPEAPSVLSQAQYDRALKRWFIEFTVDEPGGFANYRLRIDDPRASSGQKTRIDPAFNQVQFSFKAGCEDTLDCAPQPTVCPALPLLDFPVDYQARDFVSFRNALLDFSAQRYPNWSLPIEADAGVMLAEVFAALGDEFSYLQERYAREAFLETATQRRSLRKKARLLDFEIHDGRNPTTLLEVEVQGYGTLPVGAAPFEALDRALVMPEKSDPYPAELRVESDDGRIIVYEFGHGLFDNATYLLDAHWNKGAFKLYDFEPDGGGCLPLGTNSILVQTAELGPRALGLLDRRTPRYLLLEKSAAEGELPRVHFARIVDITSETDPLLELALSRLHFHPEDALPFELSKADVKLCFNVVFATAGKTKLLRFTTGESPDGSLEPLVYRESGLRDEALAPRPYPLLGIPESDTLGLGFLGGALRATTPEICIFEHATGTQWTYRRTLIGADPQDPVFTLEDGLYRPIRRFWTKDGMRVHRDYATSRGYSLRFGEDEFGKSPGGTFTVRYRTGPGSSANVSAGSIQLPAPVVLADSGVLLRVRNPLSVTSGVDPESARDIKLQAPEAYRQDLFFAVKPEDYGTQAEKLPFVQRAQGKQRYTGSWLTNFVTADPYDAGSLSDEQTEVLEAYMDCVRQAGRDVIVKSPQTVALDLEITLCVEPHAYASDVAAQAYEVLLGPGTGRRLKGFFHPDNFTFGTPLHRTALEAALQRISGVRSVRGMLVRQRGQRGYQAFTQLQLNSGLDQVFRLDNDVEHPENGTLRIVTEGGA